MPARMQDISSIGGRGKSITTVLWSQRADFLWTRNSVISFLHSSIIIMLRRMLATTLRTGICTSERLSKRTVSGGAMAERCSFFTSVTIDPKHRVFFLNGQLDRV